LQFERKLDAHGVRSLDESKKLREKYAADYAELARVAKEEPFPDGSSIWNHVYAGEAPKDPLAD
jgi:TPP-dependent pyruvate/acetoin dehydrogenase alpha subunit